ncbi:hypothetical protein [Robiginitalea sp.]|uniref:hypothetical protein n=1 Tax=Robiginitalea sp. TaxID=1902411 RepID=UPI003C776772
MSLIDELKRRNVIKATIAYIVVAWVLLQVFTSVLPSFETQPWVLKTLMFIMAIGLPVWVIFSWVYEITPDGLKKTAKVSKDQSITAATNKRLNIIIIITLVIAIAVSFVNRPMPSTPSEIIVNKELIMDNSIAVIPFKNLSGNIENQYFADGMMDDILNHLSGIRTLEVKSRQSAERYRESDKSIPQIGRELGTNYLLEGSVQKHEDSIRVIVQLIDAKNDIHLWSHRYDSELKNVFAIQSEISKQIANELNAVISPFETQQIEKTPTENLEAYSMYLKGRFFWHRRSEDGIYKSIDFFNQAIELDSTYTLAYSGLADSYFVMPFHISVNNRDSVFAIAKEYAQKALSFDKNNAEVHATLGGILCHKDWNWEASEKEFKLAIKLNSNYATAYQWYAELLDFLGRNQEAREKIDIALKLNPNSVIIQIISAALYIKDGNFDKAIIAANRGKEIDKSNPSVYWILFESYWRQGADDTAIAEIEEWGKLDPGNDMIERCRKAYDKEGIKGFYKSVIDYDLQNGYADYQPIYMAEKYALLGEEEKALDWIEKAFEQHNVGAIKNNIYFKNIKTEPRFIAILEKMGLADN